MAQRNDLHGETLIDLTRRWAPDYAVTLVGAALRVRAADCTNTQAWEFQAHDVEIGFHYPDGGLLPDGADPVPRDPTGRDYTPTTWPGHRLPHAWPARGGDRVSTDDLVGAAGGFALITGARFSRAAAPPGATRGLRPHSAGVGRAPRWPSLTSPVEGALRRRTGRRERLWSPSAATARRGRS